MQMSFGAIEMMQRVRKDSTLSKVNLFINWEAVRPTTSASLPRRTVDKK